MPPNVASEKDGRLSFRPPPSEKRLGRSAMLLPEQYAWFDPVLIAAIVVFVITLIGNTIGFGNRFVGALMSAILFALVFGAVGGAEKTNPPPPEPLSSGSICLLAATSSLSALSDTGVSVNSLEG